MEREKGEKVTCQLEEEQGLNGVHFRETAGELSSREKRERKREVKREKERERTASV